MNRKDKQTKYCSWCAKITQNEQIQLPETPILEYIEERINEHGRNRIWGKYADWSTLDLDSDFEAELLVYDELMNSVSLKTVCKQCIEEDDILWENYYGNGEVDFWDDVDFHE